MQRCMYRFDMAEFSPMLGLQKDSKKNLSDAPTEFVPPERDVPTPNEDG